MTEKNQRKLGLLWGMFLCGAGVWISPQRQKSTSMPRRGSRQGSRLLLAVTILGSREPVAICFGRENASMVGVPPSAVTLIMVRLSSFTTIREIHL
jgi:hypothetical protein